MQNRRNFRKNPGLATAVLILFSGLAAATEHSGRPNIVFIMTDDHAAQAIGCYGSRINKTPNIDRIAEKGIRFGMAFCTNAICAPSRAVLLTGKYSHLNGLIDNAVTFDGSQQTFPKLLQQAGYETALFGKWHLKSAPTGFDYHSILPGQGYYYNPDFIVMGEKQRRSGYVTDLITDDCLNWLKNRKEDKPFCVLLHHKAPHRNWMPGPKHLDLFWDQDIPEPETLFDDYKTRCPAAREQEMTVAEHFYLGYDLKLPPGPETDEETKWAKSDRRMWDHEMSRLDEAQRLAWDAAYETDNARFKKAPPFDKALVRWKYQRYIKDYLRCIASVDENIGRVLDYLKSSGLEKNTIVVYTSDQGFFLGEHGWFDKRFMYEEALRIPLIVQYPAEIAAGRINDRDMVLNLDFAATFLDFAGIDTPGDMQGRSFRSLLQGSAPDDWRRSIYYHYYEYPGCHAVKRHYGIRTAQYKLIHFYNDIDAWEHYDLKADPFELNNLYDDPAHRSTVEELTKELYRLRELYGDTDDNPLMPAPKIVRDHKARGCSVTLEHAFSPRYTAGGPGALTDGVMSADTPGLRPDYSLWQGFEEVDLDAVVDLGSVMSIDRVKVGFLRNKRDWIFLPTLVGVALSLDGKHYTRPRMLSTSIAVKQEGIVKRTIEQQYDGTKARYLKVTAKNVGRCPEGHAGEGGKAWLFVDEIVVE